MKKYFKYENVVWSTEVDHLVENKALQLLSDYFEVTNEVQELDFNVTIITKNHVNIKEILLYGREIIIHNSKKAAVHEKGLMLDNGLTRQIYNMTTKSVYSINYVNDTVVIYNKDALMLSKDYVRVVRDLVKLKVEEKNAAIMLHAASLVKGNRGILLIGPKGSGKTTASLKLIYEHGFSEVSRDRSFIFLEDGKYKIKGWPNYYNLTLRTIKSFEQMSHMLPEEYKECDVDILDNMNKKIQCLPGKIGIINKEKECELTDLIFLKNENLKEVYNEEDILASSCYTPFDLNYPDWYSISPDKISDCKCSINFCNNLLTFANRQVVRWTNIDEAVSKIIT